MSGWQRQEKELLNELIAMAVSGDKAGRMTDELVRCFGSLSVLLEAAGSDQGVVNVPQSVQLLLSMMPGLTRRRRLEALGPAPLMDVRSKAEEYVRGLYVGIGFEMPMVLCLDEELRLIRCEKLNEGGLTEVQFRPRVVVREAMHSGAAAVILCHNHPSGRPFFSEADVSVTEKTRDMLSLIGLSLVDHLLVAGERAIGMRGQRFVNERDWLKSGRLIPPLGKWNA